MDNPITEGTASAVEAIASNPKVASVVAAATTTMGAASVLSEIQTVLGLISLAIGCVIGLYVLRINKIKLQIYERMRDQGASIKE